MSTYIAHRHFVAIPIVAALFLMMIVGEYGLAFSQPLSGAVIDRTIDTACIAAHDAVYARDDQKNIAYQSGTMFMRAVDETTIGIVNGSIAFAAGDVALISSSGSLTVIAATTPMIVTVRNQSTLVPVGYQAMITNAITMQRSPSIWLTLHRDAFPACDIAQPNTASNPSLLSVLRSLDSRTQNADILRDASPDFSKGIALTILAAAQKNDVPINASLIDIWELHTKRVAARDPLFVATDILPASIILPQKFAEDFPLSARKWRQAVDAIVSVLQAQEASWHNDELTRALSPSSESSTASSTASEPLFTQNPDTIRSSARDLLIQHNALFTAETTITVLDAAHIRVIGVYFAGTDGDHQYSFTLDTHTLLASQIERDGKRLPNAVHIETL